MGLAICAIKLTEPDGIAVDTPVMQTVRSMERITKAFEWHVKEEVRLED